MLSHSIRSQRQEVVEQADLTAKWGRRPVRCEFCQRPLLVVGERARFVFHSRVWKLLGCDAWPRRNFFVCAGCDDADFEVRCRRKSSAAVRKFVHTGKR